MSAERHALVKRIFLAAHEHPIEEHEALLDRLCEDDEELRQEVESLLRRAQEEPEATLTGVAGAIAPLLDRIARAPAIHNYRVLQKIGEGGMGEVYEAEQLAPVRRRVALKLLKGGFATKEVVARFESERQALAMMNHPNIARVFAAGLTDRERPYLSMELVHGEAITDYCDRHRLTTRDRLELFVEVCAGVQHAHQKGIIHRDIKPSNVLVAFEGGQAAPKIIDFGVAKATAQRLTEHTLFTERGQWIGTPEYMSPEQAEMTGLDIDTRTDVYSLGVLLYELLVGARPFDSQTFRQAGFDEVRRRIRDEEPTRPSTKVSGLGDGSRIAAHNRQANVASLVQQLRGDLDWITLRALAKDRTRRYASPSELAADIGRHLNHEPVVACPPTIAYRVSKFVRRNRLAVLAASLITTAIMLGLMATTFALYKARTEAARANQVASFLEELVGAFDPFASLTFASTEKMLDRATARLESEFKGQDLVQARLMRRIASAYRNRDLHERGLPLAERALEILRKELGDEHIEVMLCLNELGFLAYEGGDYPRAHQFLAEVSDIQHRIFAPGDPRIALGENDLGFILWVLGDFEQAEELLERSLTTLERTNGANDLDIASNLLKQGVLFNNSGDYRRALSVLERSMQIRIASFGPDHPHVGWTARTLAQAQLHLGDYENALESGQRALEIMTLSFGSNHSDLSFALDTLGLVHASIGRFDEARALLERALALREKALGPDHPEVGLSLNKLGFFYLEVEDPAAAGPLLERALDIDRRWRIPGHPQLAWKLHSLSRQRRQSGRAEEALALQREALERLEPEFGPEHVLLAAHLAHLGTLLLDKGELAEARSLLERASRLYEHQLGPRHRRIAGVVRQLAVLDDLSGDEHAAGQRFDQALAMYKTTLGEDHPEVARCLRAQAVHLRRLGSDRAAARADRRAAEIEAGVERARRTPPETE